MNNNKKQKTIFNIKTITIICFAVIAVMAAAVGVYGVKVAHAEEWTGAEINQSYNFGEVLTVPEYTLSVNGKKLSATSVVVYPDGNNYAGSEVNLSQAGDYTVKYMATDGDKIYIKTFGFNVAYTAYLFSGGLSTAEYGKYTAMGADSEGLKVRLAKGETITFTRLIDTSELTGANNIIEGFITPDKRGTADFDKLTVTLTDISDPSIYVNIDIFRWSVSNAAYGFSCVTAAGQGQIMTGYEPTSISPGKLEVNNGKGTLIFTSWIAQFNSKDGEHIEWSGAVSPISPDKYIFSAALDLQTTIVYAQGNLVSQLNSVDFYKDVWTGFKSDKVRLSLSANGYSGSSANFCLTSVLGMDISGNSFIDSDAPVITVNSDYVEMPEGVIGRAYPIPTATAFDNYSGEVATEINVYYNYSSANPISVSIMNGSFIPDKKGYYAIVYRAKDYSSNESKKVFIMHAGAEIPPIALTLPSIVKETKLGYPLELNDAEISGGSGNIICKLYATFGGETVEISNGFKPNKAGEWRITYTAVDYVGNTISKSVIVNAKASEEPFFETEAVLDPVYISGSEYLLPELYCDDYSSGELVKKLCFVKIEYPNGKTKQILSGEKFIPEVDKNGDKVKITYFCGKEQYNNGTKEIPVLKVRTDDEIDSSAYFYGEGFFTSYEDDKGNLFEKGVLIAVEKATPEVKWTFANAQIAEGFSVEFTTFAKLTKFDTIKVVLKDLLNPKLSATFRIGVSSTGTKISNGNFSLDLKDILTEGKSGIKISYKNNKFLFGKTGIPVSTYDNGENFNGFPSGKVYFDFIIENAKRGAEYKVDAVSGSVLSSERGDYSKPSIMINGDYGGNYLLGDEYILHSAFAGDAFSPNVSVKVSVYDGKGNIATDINGVKLNNVDANKDYIIKLSNYGVWNAKYVANKENWASGIRRFTAYINVIEREAPIITINSEHTKTANVGEVIILPDFSVEDNISATEKIVITKYVINAEGKLTVLEGDSNSFRTDKAGKYVMCIMASDEFGNTATWSYTVIVE